MILSCQGFRGEAPNWPPALIGLKNCPKIILGHTQSCMYLANQYCKCLKHKTFTSYYLYFLNKILISMNLILAHKSAKRFDSFVKDSSLFENMKILKRTDSKARESSQWNITRQQSCLCCSVDQSFGRKKCVHHETKIPTLLKR